MTDPVLTTAADMSAPKPTRWAPDGGEKSRSEDFGSVLSRQKAQGNDTLEVQAQGNDTLKVEEADLPGVMEGDVQVTDEPEVADQVADNGSSDLEKSEIGDVRPAPDAETSQRRPVERDTEARDRAEQAAGNDRGAAATPAISSVAEILAASTAAPNVTSPPARRAEESVTIATADRDTVRAATWTMTRGTGGSAQLAPDVPVRHPDTDSVRFRAVEADFPRAHSSDAPIAAPVDAIAQRPTAAAQAPDFNVLHRIAVGIGDNDIAPADEMSGLEARGAMEAADAVGQRVRPAMANAIPIRATNAPFRFETVVEVAARNHYKMVEIALSPEELGRVRMSLVPSEQGVTVQIFAERQETIDLLRRHSDQLASEFERLGYDSTGFEFSGGDADRQNQDDRIQARDRGGVIGIETSAAIPVARLVMSSGVDVRV